MTPLAPTKIEPASPTELHVSWNNGEAYAVPYVEIRFACPCAGCVDENTGKRTLLRESIAADIRPLGAEIVGRYAVQISWSDRHETGMFHFDRLYHLSKQFGRRV
jgi:DUF971 family protein